MGKSVFLGVKIVNDRFAWAKACAESLPDLELVRIIDIDQFFDRIGQHTSIFYDIESDEAFMCSFLNEQKRKLFWKKIFNFKELLIQNPGLVNLWLRNGEYLHTYFTKGKMMKIVEMKFIKDFN